MEKVGVLNGKMFVAISPEEAARIGAQLERFAALAEEVKGLQELMAPVLAENGYAEEGVREGARKRIGSIRGGGKWKPPAKKRSPKPEIRFKADNRNKACKLSGRKFYDDSPTNRRKFCGRCEECLAKLRKQTRFLDGGLPKKHGRTERVSHE